MLNPGAVEHVGGIAAVLHRLIRLISVFIPHRFRPRGQGGKPHKL